LEDKVFDIVDVCVEIATSFKMHGPLDRMIIDLCKYSGIISVNSVNYDGLPGVPTIPANQAPENQAKDPKQQTGEKKDHSLVVAPRITSPIGKNANNLLSFARNEKAQKALKKAFKLAHHYANFLQEKGWFTVSFEQKK